MECAWPGELELGRGNVVSWASKGLGFRGLATEWCFQVVVYLDEVSGSSLKELHGGLWVNDSGYRKSIGRLCYTNAVALQSNVDRKDKTRRNGQITIMQWWSKTPLLPSQEPSRRAPSCPTR